MNNNKSKGSKEEFGIEFGDINAAKIYELTSNRNKCEKKEEKEEQDK